MNVIIKKLTEKTLQKAETIRDKVFGKTKKNEALTLRASLNPKDYQNVYEDNYIKDMEYWIAQIDDEVVGIIGLYTENKNNNDTCWLGWFAVKPKFRGYKIGRKLLEFAIDEAKKLEYKYLKVYTYELKNYLTAIDLYKREGFKISESNKKNKMIVLEKRIPYFEYKFEKDNIGMLVEVTPKRVIKVIENEPFAIVSTNKKEFSNSENKERNKQFLKYLREILEFEKGLIAYPLIGHWKKNNLDLIERGYLIKKPENITETEFFEVIKKITQKYNQNNFVFNGDDYKFTIYNKIGEIKFKFDKKDKENSVNIAFKKLLELENYLDAKSDLETFFHLPKDNISGARAFPKEYNYTITLLNTMEILNEK